MKMYDCPKFNICSAPLCPLNKNSLKNGEWYPNDEICHKVSERKNKRWIKIQRRIQKKTNGNPDIGEFNFAMLERIKAVGSKIHGLGDIRKPPLLRTWLQNHPPIDTKSMTVIKRHWEAGKRLAEYRVKSNV